MYPHERSLVKKLADRPFTLLGINSDESPERVKEVLERESITWPSFFDGGGTGGPIATRWRVRGWPTIFILDSTGTIRFKNLRGERMQEAVMKLLAEIEGKEEAPR